ncbi:MAG: hypothetical protein ACREMK_09570 [Gemmatimonadota bacterium]
MPAQSTWSRGMPWWSGLEDPVTEELMRAVTALEPRRVLCLDRSFRGNDELKTNTVLEMRSHDIEFQTV